MELISKCCHADVRVNSPDNGDTGYGCTNYYVCTSCDCPCDTIELDNKGEPVKPISEDEPKGTR